MVSATSHRCLVFDRIVCAVDGSETALEAARQACVLRSELGNIELVAVFEPDAANYSPDGRPLTVDDAERALADNLAAARTPCPDASSEVLYGPTVARLLERLVESDASLVAIGASSRHRGIGLVRGSVTTAMLHRAPSSVLVARARTLGGNFPRSVVVGYDGSSAANEALEVGREVAARFGATLRVVAAGDSAGVESGRLEGLRVDRDERDALEALRAVSRESDLLVVGSRGLHGLRALGSVSERIGHEAACSVLVVRQPTRMDSAG